MAKHKVIIITDGDMTARNAVEIATKNIGGRCISTSSGNPTPLTGREILEKIASAPHDPVVIMVDDRGKSGMGSGEKALKTIIESDDVEVLGVVAVSSNSRDCQRTGVTCSVTGRGDVVDGGVDKYGNPSGGSGVCGDTTGILDRISKLIIVGIGDPGKMDFRDDAANGAPVTTKALEEVIKRAEKNPPEIHN